MVLRTLMLKFCKAWRPKRAKILHVKAGAAEILHASTSCAAEILHALTSSAAEILHTSFYAFSITQWS